MQSHKTDIAIIGAGPVGLFTVFQCGMLDMQCHAVDSLPEIGGQCTALYPEKPIYDIPAYPVVTGQDLITELQAQADPFNPVYHLGQQVTALTKIGEGGWHLQTSKGTVIECRAVIIAAGAGAFGPNRPPLDNLADYEETSVHYMVRDKSKFEGKNIVIAGGGDSAVDWGIALADVAKKIIMVHRRDKFRAMPESVEKMKVLAHKNPEKFEILTPYQLSQLHGDNDQLSSVTLKSMAGDEKQVCADHLLAFYGLVPDLGPIKDWGLNLNAQTIEISPTTSETSIPAIYAVGDIAHYDHKLKLILSGFSEAASAAHHAYSYIYPDKALHFEYSTSKGINKA